jgi:hypothetical protein
VAHATENVFTIVVALRARIASAASYGADPAQTMPPPCVDSHRSRVVPKCARKSAPVSCCPSNGVYMIPSTSAGVSPASASARSTAWSAICFTVRPDAFVWSASPTPAIATAPETSSSAEANPQSSVARVMERRQCPRRGAGGQAASRPQHAQRAKEVAAQDLADAVLAPAAVEMCWTSFGYASTPGTSGGGVIMPS